MKVIQLSTIAAATLVASASVSAAPITFILNDSSQVYGGSTLEELDGSSTLSLTKSGIAANLTASTVGNATSEFNATSSNFGINSGGGDDESSLLDAGEGAESVTIAFTTAVTFESIEISDFGGTDGGSITFSNGATAVNITTTGVIDAGDVDLAIGETVTITYTGTPGNGFDFENFTVVPEPSSLAPLAIAGLLIARRRRRG